MRALFFWIVPLAIIFHSCKKSSNDDLGGTQPNWEIVKNFPEDKSYVHAYIYGFNKDVYISTYGNQQLVYPENLLHTFQGTFFFKEEGYYYANTVKESAVVALKEFNGELYGIRENRTLLSTYPILNYNYSYTLFKWKTNKYEVLDVLQYTNDFQVPNASIGDIKLWIHNGKLHMLSSQTNVLVWELVNNKFVKKSESLNVMVNDILPIDNKEVALTQVVQLVQNADRTTYVVTGYFYDGSSFRKGTTYQFVVEGDTGFSNKEADAFQAYGGNLWAIGYQSNKIKNMETNQILQGLSDKKVLRSFPIVHTYDKVFITLGDANEYSKCVGIVVFDGKSMRELPFRLPEILDPNSTVVDAMEYEGKVYLLLNNRKQYVVVRSI